MKVNSYKKIKRQAIAQANKNRKYLLSDSELEEIKHAEDAMVEARTVWENYRKGKCFAEYYLSPCVCKELPLYEELYLNVLKPLSDRYTELLRLEARKYLDLISEYEKSLLQTRKNKLEYLKKS